jgi:hypothetical protein
VVHFGDTIERRIFEGRAVAVKVPEERDYPPGDRGDLPPQRAALIRLSAAGPGKEHLRAALDRIGFPVPADVDPLEQLIAASDPAPGSPPVHPLRLALAAMQVLDPSSRPPPIGPDQLEPVVRSLLPQSPEWIPPEGAAEAVFEALQAGAAAPKEVRWAAFLSALSGRPDGISPDTVLRDELAAITEPTCEASLRSLRGEIVSTVQSRVVVHRDTALDELAPSALPQNWPSCNDFFISLTPRPDLDARWPAATAGELTPGSRWWCGVLEERVGGRPDGWFPDTRLRICWDRQARDKILVTYDLLEPIPGERTVLKVDQGVLEVHKRSDRYIVTTLKHLLFDPQNLPQGGQALGSLACELGWLDYSLNMFTDCARELSRTSPVQSAPQEPGPGRPGADALVQRALDRCEAHLRETAADAESQVRVAMYRQRQGDYGLDDAVADWAQVYRRGVRDWARSVQDQALLTRGAAKYLRDLAKVSEGPS